ncbi:hypothetical protein C8R47DRAFT_1283736 [Mycena vitilis]|nr:hypothetical protein C8R47DRAFT_1283736 [Mycena vitilis]
MSDQQPNRAPFTTLYSNIPELRHDDQGNAFCPGPDARQPWVPYHGPLPQLTQGPVAQAPQFTQAPPSFPDSNRGAPNSPIEHAFAEQYQFALRPVQSGFAPQPIPIDPALLRLPRDGPDLRKAKPAGKVSGSRRKDKGKKRQRDSSGSGHDSEPVTKRGRPQGSGNYSKEDISHLFDFVGVELPVGQKGWKEVHRRYRKYAVQHNRPERAPKALESKYKQYLKQKKPTGDAACPPEVKRAHELENLINERVGTRDLSDSEFDDDSDADAGSSDDEVEVVDRPRQRTAIARRNPTPPLRRKSRPSGADLANQLASAFDPAAQQGRDDARSQRAFENTQMLTVAQQLRDLQGVTESLRSQNSVLQNHIHDLERARDRSELKLELLQMTKGDDRERGRSRRPSHSARHPSPLPPRFHRSHKRTPGIDRVNGKIRCEQQYPDGGAMTYFLSDPSSGDEEDENANPYWDSFDTKPRVDSTSRPYSAISAEHLRHARRRSSQRRRRVDEPLRPLSRRRTPSAGPSRRPFSPRRSPSTVSSRRRTLSTGPSRRPLSRRRTPSAGPSHRRPSPSASAVRPPIASTGQLTSSVMAGHAVELVVTPRRGPPVALVISPAAPNPSFPPQ